MEKEVKNIILDICHDLGIKCTLVSKDWIFILEKDNKTVFLAGYKFPSNNHALGMILDDKYALYDVLKYKNYPVAEYNIVYSEKNIEDYAQGCNTFDYVKSYFLSHNQDVVLKPNDGTCGRDVYHVTDLNTLEELYYRLTRKYYSINIGPFYDIQNEYRFVVYNNQIRIAYKKNKPVVYGDGVKTIKQLLIDFNPDYFIDKLNDSLYETILPKGQEYEYNWKFNLSGGAVATPIDDQELYDRLSKIALDSTQEIGLQFGSVDIIYTKDNEAFILEMNSGVMLENYVKQFDNGYNITKELYKEVIIDAFKK